MRWTHKIAMVLAAALISVTAAHAVEMVDRIAAVVNEDAITVRDLEERVRMAMFLSQLKDSAEVRKRVIPQILRKMIDEHLILQEAKKFKITVNAAEVDNSIHMVERQNNIPEGALIKELTHAGIAPEALRDQFTADLTWQRLSAGTMQNAFRVADDEVKERLNVIAAQMGKPEYMVADILLLVDNPSQEDQVRNLGERLIEQLQAGAPFPVLASQFSQAPSASNGGNMGWINEGSIDDELFAIVKDMTPGTVTKLLRAADGYHIMALVNRRIAGTGIPGSDATITFSQMLLPVPTVDAPPKNVLLSKAALLVRGVKNCDEFEAVGRKEAATEIGRTGPVKLTTIAQPILGQIINVPQGEIAIPADDPKGVRLTMMCARVDTPAPLPSADMVRRQIEDERMGMLGRRLMRDMHHAAFIDTRL